MSDIVEQANQAAIEAERGLDVLAYIGACNAGDFDTMIEIARRAESDPLLEEALWQADLEMAKDEIVTPGQVERAHKKIKHIFKQYFEER